MAELLASKIQLFYLLLVSTLCHAATITVERNYDDLNDRFTLGSKNPWDYQCNEGDMCSCYYRGTYSSPENKQARCYGNGQYLPNSNEFLTYTNSLDVRIGNAKIKKIWFWNLKRGTERGIYEKDYSESAIKYFEVDSGYMIVTGLPANWAGQLVIAVLNTGKHIVFKVTGTITYPFDFESIFTKPTTTTTTTTAAPTTTTTDVPKTTSSIATTTTTKTTITTTAVSSSTTQTEETTTKPTTVQTTSATLATTIVTTTPTIKPATTTVEATITTNESISTSLPKTTTPAKLPTTASKGTSTTTKVTATDQKLSTAKTTKITTTSQIETNPTNPLLLSTTSSTQTHSTSTANTRSTSSTTPEVNPTIPTTTQPTNEEETTTKIPALPSTGGKQIKEKEETLGMGIIIALSIISLAVLVLVLIFFILCRRRKRNEKDKESNEQEVKTETITSSNIAKPMLLGNKQGNDLHQMNSYEDPTLMFASMEGKEDTNFSSPDGNIYEDIKDDQPPQKPRRRGDILDEAVPYQYGNVVVGMNLQDESYAAEDEDLDYEGLDFNEDNYTVPEFNDDYQDLNVTIK